MHLIVFDARRSIVAGCADPDPTAHIVRLGLDLHDLPTILSEYPGYKRLIIVYVRPMYLL